MSDYHKKVGDFSQRASRLAHLATNQFIISRLTATTGYKREYTTTTGMEAAVQPLNEQRTQLFGGTMGKTFIIYCDGSLTIEDNDSLRDVNTGSVYKVKTGGVVRRTHGSVDFLEVVVELVD